MRDVHRIGTSCVQRAPGFIGNGHIGKGKTGLGRELTNVDKTAIAYGIPLPPSSAGRWKTLVGDRSVIHD